MNTLYLETEVKVSRDCASFYFKDVTPEFDLVSSPNGYDPTGISCVDPANLDSITIKVSQVNSTATPVTINVSTSSSAFDATRIPGVVQYTITNSTLSTVSYTISGAIGTGTAITYTTSTAHTFSAGQTVVINGLVPSQFNMTATIASVPDSTSFTVYSNVTGQASGSGTASLTSTVIQDGIYKFTYTVVDTANNDQVYQRTCYVLNDCAICCALDQKLKDLKSCGTCNEKNNKTINMLYEAYMLKQKAHHLVACHDFVGAQEVIDYLNRLLDIKYCDNCNS